MFRTKASALVLSVSALSGVRSSVRRRPRPGRPSAGRVRPRARADRPDPADIGGRNARSPARLRALNEAPSSLRAQRSKDGDGVMGAICAAQGTGPPAHARPPPSRKMPRQRHADPLDGDARLARPATTSGRRALPGGLLRGLLCSRLRMTGMARSSAGQDQASACYTVQQRGPAR